MEPVTYFHSHVQVITRGKGKSAVASAAYQAGQTIKNEYDGITHDYTRKRNVVHTEILLPDHAPKYFYNRAILWNAVEKIEKASNAQLVRQLDIGLPAVFTLEQNISLARRYLQFFCGYSGFEDGRPFDASLMVYFRKRLTPEILGEINELIIKRAKERESQADNDNDGKPSPPGNGGTLIVDTTCAPSQIKYPQDTELLNEAREITEEIIDALYDPMNGKKPRAYRKQARKAHLNRVRKRKKTTKEIRKAIKKQLGYLRRNLKSIDKMLLEGKNLFTKKSSGIETVQTLYLQQKFMYDNRVRSVSDRIVSLSQPWLRQIVRGKAKSSVEFGTKLDISVADGFVRLERQSFDPYHEAHFLKETIMRYHERCGHYPSRVLADKSYRNRDNRERRKICVKVNRVYPFRQESQQIKTCLKGCNFL